MGYYRVLRLVCDGNHMQCHQLLSTDYGPFYRVWDARATAKEVGWFCVNGLDLCPVCRESRGL